MNESKKLIDVYKICASLLCKDVKNEIAYFIAVRSFILKTTKQGVPDLAEVNKRISEILDQAILGDEVLSKEIFELLTDDNLNKLKALPQKNMAANILMRVMKDKVNDIKKINSV